MAGKRKAEPAATIPPAPGCRGLPEGEVNGVPRYKLEDERNVAMLQALFYSYMGFSEESRAHRDAALRLAAELGVVLEGPSGYPGQGDAWADFLHHRARVIDEHVAEGRPYEEIAKTLSMDPVQVRLIYGRSR
jgi:hypothetical protein